MIYELDDTSKVKHLFDGWNETLIFSCIQKVMGKIYVTDIGNPKAAFAYVGCFGFYAGEPEKELVINKPEGFVILIPQNEAWAKLIKECFPTAKQVTRYAIKKNTRFNEEVLRKNIRMLPKGYELKRLMRKYMINAWRVLLLRILLPLLKIKKPIYQSEEVWL